MRASHKLGWIIVALFVMALAASQMAVADDKAPDKDSKAKIKANLAKLPAKDRKLAQSQNWCAIENDNLLGEMGVPVKVVINGQPVFCCCKSCVKEAKAHPDETLDAVKKLRAKAAKESEK